MDLAFLKDKKLQLALGGGAVLGLVVIVRKKQGGGGGSTSSTTGTAGTLGTYTDNGMDAYQNLNNELEAGLSGFQTQITQVQDQLAKLSPKPSTSSGPSAHQLHVQHLKNKGTPAKPKAKPDAHQQHVQHVKNTTPKKATTPTAHQLHVEHVKNKGPAPKRRR